MIGNAREDLRPSAAKEVISRGSSCAAAEITIAETASAEAGGSKPGWITALVPYLSGQASVNGFVWFDMNKENDWRIDSSPASAAAFPTALSVRT